MEGEDGMGWDGMGWDGMGWGRAGKEARQQRWRAHDKAGWGDSACMPRVGQREGGREGGGDRKDGNGEGRGYSVVGRMTSLWYSLRPSMGSLRMVPKGMPSAFIASSKMGL